LLCPFSVTPCINHARLAAAYSAFLLPTPTAISTLSLHDALPISIWPLAPARFSTITFWPRRSDNSCARMRPAESVALPAANAIRSEEHTSELQSRVDLVCRLLLEKKKATTIIDPRLLSGDAPRS